jgi:hypothetical protein
MQLEFEVDKLTHSLEDAKTGKILSTDVLPLSEHDLKGITKKNGWKFNWKTEFSDLDKQVFKLILCQQPDRVQGLICLQMMPDYIFMPLIETAPHNFGKKKQYKGVAGNLVAYGCKLAFIKGFEGIIAFDSKTGLIAHYQEKLGAKVLFGQRMVIETKPSIKLINDYYPEFFNK